MKYTDKEIDVIGKLQVELAEQLVVENRARERINEIKKELKEIDEKHKCG